MSAASLAKALSTWAAAWSSRWSKLPRSVLPSSAMTRRPGAVLTSPRCWAWRRKAASIAAGSSACKRARSVLTAGARRKRAPKVHIQPLAMHADEQADAAVGGGAGQDGQHREQQQGGKAVTLSLAAARIGDLFQGGEQAGERHHGGLRGKGFGPQRPM